MGLLHEMKASFLREYRRGFDSRCGCSLPDGVQVLAVLRAVGPASREKVARLLGVNHHHCGSVGRILDDLLECGYTSHLRGEYRVIEP